MSSGNIRRIQKELAEVHNSTGLQAIRVETDDENVLFWKASIQGPDSGPYQSGVFDLNVSFPPDYPFKAPLIKFTTRIYHPNVDDEGNICVGLLKQDAWKPATKMATVLLSIYNLLSEPNPDDPLVASVAELYKTNRKEFDANARAYVQKYAVRK
ncbi:ubiquitin-conjugating enzyme [Phaffia rhodozyma]|uniref:E2 ubiquitin-conjugating enzyme n=1 Tax=Phaffia rhodozyma TaxID=264483 RepID=A0A0F7SFW4_PHARH|nr:ubiquitin-conjugating enzyme [Phaffia rhodozyma]